MLGKQGRKLVPPFSAPSLFSYNELREVPFREDDRLHLLIWQYRGRTQPEAVEVSPFERHRERFLDYGGHQTTIQDQRDGSVMPGGVKTARNSRLCSRSGFLRHCAYIGDRNGTGE